MHIAVRTDKSLPMFFLLLIVLSLPFWLLGALVEPENLPINLPTSALMVFNPMIAALILVFRERGSAGVKELLRKPFDFRSIRPQLWYLPLVLVMPTILLLSYGLTILLGRGVSDPHVPLAILPILLVVFTVSAYGEEVGWQGYAFEPLEARWGTFGAGFVLGIVWAVWHIIPFMQTHNPAGWIFWQCVFTVAFRLLIAWFYTNTGRSVLAAIVVHTMSNVAAFMTPNYGSQYDPFLTSIIIGAIGVILYRGKTIISALFSKGR